MLLAAAVIALVAASLPAVIYLRNLGHYRAPGPPPGDVGELSILIPARNEAAGIRDALASALASENVRVEVVVLDDASTDGTAEVVQAVAAADPRVRLVPGPPMPVGWAGKQHACWCLAAAARHDRMLFLDADVRLEPDGAARLVHYFENGRADLLSGIPRQVTGTWMERLLIPLIHFLLLSYLPMARMRHDRHSAFGAGCGQLFLTGRSAYEKSGGHAAIRSSYHDGLQLPRAYRRARLRTDLCDATAVASCRMYGSATDLWNGLAKNAGEGIGSARGIVPWTILLGCGHVLPFALLAAAAWLPGTPRALAAAACALSMLPRLLAVRPYRQSWTSALLQPIGISLLLTIQWYAMARRLVGRPVGWRGRTPADTS